ncbi:MAG: hypothetical protein KGZ53_02770 [Peptococcaceae bacterium]|nr:hypothetical protein [Peptococcaceae bacterium]
MVLYTTEAHIRSLDEVLKKVSVLKKVGDNDYLVEYNNNTFHAIFNPFVGRYFVDDVSPPRRNISDR